MAAAITCAALALADVVLIVVARNDLEAGDVFFNSLGVLAGFLYAAIGFLIVLRARNSIGWILAASGFLLLLPTFGVVYPVVAIQTHPDSLPGPTIIAAFTHVLFGPLMISIAVMLLVFPDGRPPSPRWRPIEWIAIAGGALGYVLMVVRVDVVSTTSTLSFPNPLKLHRFEGAISNAVVAAAWIAVLAGIACAFAIVIRFRRGSPEVRQQVKWLALAAAGAGVWAAAGMVSLVICSCDESPIGDIAFLGFFLITVLGVPAAVAIAVFRYRLYEIDLFISKAVLYGLLAAFFTAVYAAIVLGVGAAVGQRGNSFLTIAAALVIALAFGPVRERARRLANRLVYGKRATPYEVLSEFSERVAGTYASDDVLLRMAEVLGAGTGASRARVWLRVGGELRAEAAWPADARFEALPMDGDSLPALPRGEQAVEVRHQGDLLGALSVLMPPSDPMNPAKERLVADLAAQAGLVLRNVRLISELRASRQRLVAAQDEERRRLERNLHDGAQQQLVALAVKLRLAEGIAERDPPGTKAMLGALQTETGDALENLRDLARGIYPPLLADQGLVVALDAQARRASVPTEVHADRVGRYPQAVESAVYFCTLEALNNVAKYAGANRAEVRLSAANGELVFEVVDDGGGFDTNATNYGTGLQGMADRLDAIGGTLHVRSAPGSGTVVAGRVPATAVDAT